MEKCYRRGWGTKAAYIAGTGLIIGGAIAQAKGVPGGWYYAVVGGVLDCLACLHDRWEHKQRIGSVSDNLKDYPV